MKIDLQELKWEGIAGFSGLGRGQVVGCCEHSNEPSYSRKYR